MEPSSPCPLVSSLEEFTALYHPKLTMLHHSMGHENVRNLYSSCTHWKIYERLLLGDLVPFKQTAPPEDMDAACEDIVNTYIDAMDLCLGHYTQTASGTPQVIVVSKLHSLWKIEALDNCLAVVRELRNLVSIELSFVPGYETATKGTGRIDDMFRDCVSRSDSHSMGGKWMDGDERLLYQIPKQRAPAGREWVFETEQQEQLVRPRFPSFGGGGDPYEPISGP